MRAANKAVQRQQEMSGDDCEDKDDEIKRNINPDNVTKNNLKVMEFYSADDIRQTMKAVFAGKSTHYVSEGECSKGLRIQTVSEIINKSNKSPQEELLLKQDKILEETQKVVVESQNSLRKKTRGRPPKAGPSKVPKKTRIRDFYIGKLSNVASFRGKRDNTLSNSSSESGLFY